MSRDPTYAQFPYPPTKNQHLHTSATATQQSLHHHQFTPQQNPFTPQDSITIAQAPSGTPSQYTTSQNSSIAQPNLGTQTRRYKAQQHTSSIAPPTPNTPSRQYPSTHPSISPLNEHPTSPLISTQCLPTTNNVTTISSISSLPASLPTPPTVPTGLSSPNGTNTAATSFELQDIIAQFGTQPELLKLILTSKVEEDKRRAEEAKLRVKELEIILCQRDRQRKCIDHADESRNDDIHSNQDMDYENENSIGPFDGSINYAFNSTSLSSPVQNLSLNSPSSTTVSQSIPRLKRHNSAPKGQLMLQLPFHNQMISHNSQLTCQNSQNKAIQNSTENEECNVNCAPNKRKRKRREMLPVTMIVEAKDNPHKDEYLWKNNGNTTQRKTGNKSVYFKCSNSNKGCPVNKTVTEKEGGWIIKYRGHHLEECGKIKRIVQS